MQTIKNCTTVCWLFGCYCCIISVIGKYYECRVYVGMLFLFIILLLLSVSCLVLFFKSAFVKHYSLYYALLSLPTDLHSISKWLISIVNLCRGQLEYVAWFKIMFYSFFFYFNHFYLGENALVFEMFQL